ncbi:MAG: response regulator [Eubacterium sp.]|nr:response regulator [Eubacterium sp.]
MSRIESGRMVLRNEEFSFSDMLEQINTMVMSQCNDKGLHYECRILSPVDNNYLGDDMKLKEVLINILSNAIKFTEAPGSVIMSVERTAVFEDQSTLRFCIKDTGLGMAITRGIIELMNGTINVESEKGVGTEFTVTVTLRNCMRRDEHPEDLIDLHSRYALVVDDDEVDAEHARMVLGEAGIRADVCAGGEEALRMMEVQNTKHEPYNLILMDWKMSEMDGLEASEKIRKQFSADTTIIILTAYNWDSIKDEAEQAGIDSILSKPLFAPAIIEEFKRLARRNKTGLLKEKKQASLAGRRILLAEDMEINAEIMMDILDMEDMLVDHAENGRIAVEMFAESEVGTYAAILMDVRMPEMDGLEATAAIRSLDREDAGKIPVIALTANAFDEDVQRSLQSGMNAHLSKPVEPDRLYRTLGELIYEAEN